MKYSILLVAILSVLASGTVFAQASQSGPRGGMYSPNAQGVQIQGNTEIKAGQENSTAVSVGEGNTAKNTAGAIKGGTQIQGNTKIHAKQKNSTAVSVGKDNASANEAGTIGGN
jgi:hypothetical protein